MRVAAVLLHYRFWPALRPAVDALQRQSHRLDSVTLVDNNSDDGSVAEIRAAYPEIAVVESPRNAGYAGGMNLGARTSLDADALLFVTHECLLAEGAVAALLRELDAHPGVGLTGPVLGLLEAPEQTWSAGGGVGRRTGRTFHDAAGQPFDAVAAGERRRVRWLDGAAILVRRSAFDQVGGFDERYFLYDEEVDLALRLARAGWEITCVPAARAWQRPAMAPPYLATRNRLLLLSKNPDVRRFLPVAIAILFGELLQSLPECRTAEGRRRLQARVLGAMDAVTGRLRPAWTTVR